MANLERNLEGKYGCEFGSGRVLTNYVGELLGKLRNKSGSINNLIAHELALAVAWANGCPQPEKNIAKIGALNNAKGDARNNLLFGRLVAQAANKEDQTLFEDLTSGVEPLAEDATLENESVPPSVSHDRVLTGFAQSSPYEVATNFWRWIDQADAQDQKTKLFNVLTDRLRFAVENSPDLETFKTNALTLMKYPINQRRIYGSETEGFWIKILAQK